MCYQKLMLSVCERNITKKKNNKDLQSLFSPVIEMHRISCNEIIHLLINGYKRNIYYTYMYIIGITYVYVCNACI